jgi:hypothetical protein
MPGLYDSYQLANSRLNRQYTGNSLDELTKVSDVMQSRYDASVAGMEGLDQYIKNAKALPQDQQLLADRTQQYTNQLSDWSKRKDLENVTMDVAKAGRRYANEYQNFASRFAEYNAYRESLDKKVDDKKLSRGTADQLLAMSTDKYQGMQYDKTTGKYSGIFNGRESANEVDIPEWVKKVAGDIAASKHGTLVEGPQGDYFIKNGSSMERITQDQINKAVKAGLDSDPEIQSHINQAAMLSGWRASKLNLSDLGETGKGLAKIALQSGIDPKELLNQYGANQEKGRIVKDIYGLASKYAYQKSETSHEYDGFTVEGHRKANKPYDDAMLSISSTSPGTGIKIESGADFQQLKSDTEAGLKGSIQSYSHVLKQNEQLGTPIQKGTGDLQGRFWRLNKDGTKTEVTDEIAPLQQNIEYNKKLLDYHNEVDQEAQKVSGFDKESKNPVLLKKAQAAYDKVMGIGSSVSNAFGHTETKETIAQKKQTAQQAYDAVMQDSPAYKEYVEEVKKRLSNPAESSTILAITNPEDKKGWSDAITNMSSKLGLDDGALAFTIGSGPDQGQQISGKDYDQIKGAVDVIGPSTDQHGNIILLARANKDIKGKKTSGKDLLLQLPQTSVLDYLKGKVNNGDITQAQVDQLQTESVLKQQLDNKYRRASMYIPDTNVAADVKQEGQKWIITYPLADGNTKRVVALSYQGISDALHQATKDYK